MANKAGNMLIFILGLVISAPAMLVSGLLSLAWVWEYIRGCFLSSSYYCGQGHIFKAFIFGAISYGCFNLIRFLWAKAK